ncbi:MAG TPA: hypothetical protein VN541_04950 [Tepidisphaeraceae bacterium]|nr:hypothetical protein [Tepidisphaeraceae bacterium]
MFFEGTDAVHQTMRREREYESRQDRLAEEKERESGNPPQP